MYYDTDDDYCDELSFIMAQLSILGLRQCWLGFVKLGAELGSEAEWRGCDGSTDVTASLLLVIY